MTLPILLLILLLVVVLGLPIVMLLVAGERLARKDRRMDAEGVTTQAEISDLQAVARRSYLVTFRYHPVSGSEPVTASAAVSRQVFENLKLGQSITVRYLPDEPQTTRVLGDVPARPAGRFVTLQGFILLGALLFSCLTIWGLLPAEQKRADQNATYTAYANTRTPEELAATDDHVRIELQPLRGEIEAKLDTFRQEATDRAQTYDPELLGIRYDLAEIYYGRCDDRFYVFAVRGAYRGLVYVVRQGYAYMEDGMAPEGCSTDEFGSLFSRSGPLGGGWYVVEAIRTDRRTDRGSDHSVAVRRPLV